MNIIYITFVFVISLYAFWYEEKPQNNWLLFLAGFVIILAFMGFVSLVVDIFIPPPPFDIL